MRPLIPIWIRSSFDLLMHGELHYTLPEEFDSRVALISFDNAIEASIACYLKLHPSQRGNREYVQEKVKNVLEGNYHIKLDFFYEEITLRGDNCRFTKEEIIYIHRQRDLFYHESPDFMPSGETLSTARDAAFFIFSFLFEVPDLNTKIAERIKQIRKLDLYQRDLEIDKMIDEEYQVIEILGIPYKPSDVLFAVDPIYYQEFGKEVRNGS